MKVVFALFTAVAAFTAYYVYRPIPSTVSEPWKLMLLDATIRWLHDTCNLADYFGLGHHLKILHYMSSFEKNDPVSSGNLKVTDTIFDGVEVRVFEPSSEPHGTLKRSIVYIHGGGWALASARSSTYDGLCRKVSEEVNAVVVSIEYRLVPDVHFPTPLNDVLTATKYFLHPDVLQKYSVDPDRIAVSGDSAGGNLAAAVCQQSDLAHYFGLGHRLRILHFMTTLDKNDPVSSGNLKVTDTVFDGVEVRVFEPTSEPHGELKRSIVFVHGGGWVLASARARSYGSLCQKVSEDVNAVVVSIE
uniref:Alpha/beta hydrolase fold-3 domain-containing protein n=1 Tax=Leptobrachium leishanense TaxID=445787 RepID=A0A8C5WI44_9ANUR